MTYFEERMAKIKENPSLVTPTPVKPGKVQTKSAKPEKEAKPVVVANPYDPLGWIYFITNENEDVVKIGFTTNRSMRLHDLQTGNHSRLHMECSFPACKSVEAMLHERFSKDRISGEWFYLTDEIEELWDDLWDYQGMRCASHLIGEETGNEFLDDIDRRPIGHADIKVILATIGAPWPHGFVIR